MSEKEKKELEKFIKENGYNEELKKISLYVDSCYGPWAIIFLFIVGANSINYFRLLTGLRLNLMIILK